LKTTNFATFKEENMPKRVTFAKSLTLTKK